MSKRKSVIYAIIVNIVIIFITFCILFFYLGKRPNKYVHLKRGELSENVDKNIPWDGICIKYKKGENDYRYLYLSEDLNELNDEFGTEYEMGDKVWILYYESAHLMYPMPVDPIFIF